MGSSGSEFASLGGGTTTIEGDSEGRLVLACENIY